MATKKKVIPAAAKLPRGPVITMAAFCEKILTDRDGVQSLIRMYDRLMIPPMPRDAPKTITIPLALAIGFRSGDFVGKKRLQIRPRKGAGDKFLKINESEKVVIEFGGGQHGAVINAQVAIQFRTKRRASSMLIWFERTFG